MTNKGLHSPSSRLHTFLKHTETLSTCMQVALLDQNAFPHEAAVCRNENSKHTHFRPRADCLSYPPAPPIRTSDTGTGFLMVVVTCVTNASSFVHTRCFWHSFPLSTFRRSPYPPRMQRELFPRQISSRSHLFTPPCCAHVCEASLQAMIACPPNLGLQLFTPLSSTSCLLSTDCKATLPLHGQLVY